VCVNKGKNLKKYWFLLKDKLLKVLKMDCSPKKIALASAGGMLVGISPYFGFHTGLAIVVSFIFNLPIYPLMIGAYITNPLTFIPIYALTYQLGALVLGREVAHLDWSNLSINEFVTFIKKFFFPFWVGTHLAGIILSIFTYFIVYYIVIAYRRKTSLNDNDE